MGLFMGCGAHVDDQVVANCCQSLNQRHGEQHCNPTSANENNPFWFNLQLSTSILAATAPQPQKKAETNKIHQTRSSLNSLWLRGTHMGMHG